MRRDGTTGLLWAGVALVFGGIGAWVFGRKKKEAAAPPPGATAGASWQMTGYPVPPTPQAPAAQIPTAAGTVSAGAPQIVFPQALPQNIQQKVANAVSSGDPAQMRAVAAELETSGNTLAAQQLNTIATTVEGTKAGIDVGVKLVQSIIAPGSTQPPAGTPTTPVGPAPGATTPAGPTAPAPTPTTGTPSAGTAGGGEREPDFTIPRIPGVSEQPIPVRLPAGFQLPGALPGAPQPVLTSPAWPGTDPVKVDLANRMNIMLASKKPYTEDTALVKQFQSQESLSPVDGLYGPGTATRLAQQYGIVPTKPYYWSKTASKVPAQKAEYRAAMLALATRDPGRAADWQAAANV